MISTRLQPKEITDIVSKMEEYIEALREMKEDDRDEYVNHLENFFRSFFSNSELQETALKTLIFDLVDQVYIYLMSLSVYDAYTTFYFGVILDRLFWELRNRGILMFYIIDNSLRDDRFKFVIDLFRSASFATISPYKFNELTHSDKYTELPTLTFNEIKKQIDNGINDNKNIIYVEKDDSVNYLSDVLKITEDIQNKYVCGFRNKAIPEKAIRFLGSFGNILDNG